jgi:2-C-methyl-D-erythritol 2,4-cyclodiphosphate synthase
MSSRIGIGYDIHRLIEGRELFIGGVKVAYSKGLLGHSDGDVLLHAVCDALLGATGAEDIGEHFPDSDPQYYGIASSILLQRVQEVIARKGYVIDNIDAVVIAQEPILSGYKKAMCEKIAQVLSLPASAVNVKAKSNEGLGTIGNKEAIACYAVALVHKEV